MACSYNCVTIKDFLRGLGIDNVSCASKVVEFNSIIRKLYLDTFDTDFNRVSQSFSGNGDMTINTDFPIYKLIGIFWNKDCSVCGYNACTLDMPTCESGCDNLAVKIKQVTPRLSNDTTDLKSWEYNLGYACINVNIPTSLEDGFVVYQRWPQLFWSATEQVCLPDSMFVALEYLTLHDYAIKNKQFEVAQFYSWMYDQVIKKLKDKEATAPFAVGRGANIYQSNNSTNVWK
jgi:hypothetical protein